MQICETIKWILNTSLSSYLGIIVPRVSTNHCFLLLMPKGWLVQLKFCITQTVVLCMQEEEKEANGYTYSSIANIHWPFAAP